LAWFLRGGSSPAWALVITGATCTQQADNSLRFDCTVTTDVASNAFIKFGEDLPVGCQEPRSTAASFNKTSHEFTLHGLKPSDTFDWRDYASPASGGSGVSRGVVYDLDASAGTASATAQYTMEDLGAADLYCPTGSSLWQMLAGHALATCAEVGGTNTAMVNEFDSSDSVVWAVELECDAGYQRNGTAFRGYANVW